ncbi:unnamed protein product [Ambrosiozyma monospora]|uniref:Unnamed protein product n=1 Tax=Ambrosiozyma monospora TaxID=43982 RepID=A0ACB5SVL0_AMBMO|nr:unnamed protein product [Ambrosiozyma monospora]
MARPPNSWVWQHFTHISTENNRSSVECRVCHKTFKYAPRNGPTNLARHVRKAHNITQPESAVTRRPFGIPSSSRDGVNKSSQTRTAPQNGRHREIRPRTTPNELNAQIQQQRLHQQLDREHRENQQQQEQQQVQVTESSQGGQTESQVQSQSQTTGQVNQVNHGQSSQRPQQRQHSVNTGIMTPQEFLMNGLIVSNDASNSPPPPPPPPPQPPVPSASAPHPNGTQSSTNPSVSAVDRNSPGQTGMVQNRAASNSTTNGDYQDISRSMAQTPMYRLSPQNNITESSNGTRSSAVGQTNSQNQQQQQSPADLQQDHNSQQPMVRLQSQHSQSQTLSHSGSGNDRIIPPRKLVLPNSQNQQQQQPQQQQQQQQQQRQQQLLQTRDYDRELIHQAHRDSLTTSSYVDQVSDTLYKMQAQFSNVFTSAQQQQQSHQMNNQLGIMIQELTVSHRHLQEQLKLQQRSVVRLEQRVARSANLTRSAGLDREFEILPFSDGRFPGVDDGLPLLSNVFVLFGCAEVVLDRYLSGYDLNGNSDANDPIGGRERKVIRLGKFIGCTDIQKYWSAFVQSSGFT